MVLHYISSFSIVTIRARKQLWQLNLYAHTFYTRLTVGMVTGWLPDMLTLKLRILRGLVGDELEDFVDLGVEI